MKRFERILCAIGPEAGHCAAVERAVTLAENNQANLTLVGVADPALASGGPGLHPRDAEGLSATLEGLAAFYAGRLAIRTRVQQGTPFLELTREVLRGRHDLLIKVAERAAWLERLLGSDDIELLRTCPCPLWLCRANEPSNYQSVLVAVDLDDTCPAAEREARQALNRQALEMAVSLALSDFAQLHLVHVWDAIGEGVMRGAILPVPQEQASAYVDQVRRRRAANLDTLLREVADQIGGDAIAYLKPQVHLIRGQAREEIPALAERLRPDLIVMGTVARTGVPGLLMGNTAESILDRIDSAVLAIKPPGFVTPIALDG
jgi:universal stress protein E